MCLVVFYNMGLTVLLCVYMMPLSNSGEIEMYISCLPDSLYLYLTHYITMSE